MDFTKLLTLRLDVLCVGLWGAITFVCMQFVLFFFKHKVINVCKLYKGKHLFVWRNRVAAMKFKNKTITGTKIKVQKILYVEFFVNVFISFKLNFKSSKMEHYF